MGSRSSTPSELGVSVAPSAPRGPLNAWILSTASHALVAGIFLGSIFINAIPRKKTVDMEIIEAPKEAPKAVSLQAPPKPKPKIQPRAVFGLSRKAAAVTESNVEVKAGNTIAKEQDNEKLRDDDPDALPVPAEEYLVTQMPALMEEMRIPYPDEAKRAGVQGAVVMDLLIDETGSVRQVELVDGPGHGLNEAATQAVRGFKFRPASIQDKPVAVRIRYAYRFVLER